MIIDPRSMNAVRLEKLRDLDVVPVLFALEIIFYQDERLFRGTTDAVKFPVRSALFDRQNFYFIDIESRKVPPRLAEKDLGSHESDVDVAMCASGGFSGADNTTNQFTFGSNLCTGPQNRVLQNRAGADPAILADN